jgi:hypothetical protein
MPKEIDWKLLASGNEGSEMKANKERQRERERERESKAKLDRFFK